MSSGTRDSSAGVSYRDCGSLLRRIGATHNGIADYVVGVPMRSGHGVELEVVCRFRRANGKPGEWNVTDGVSGRWPSGASSTFAGFLFKLAYDLSFKLEQQEEAAERAALKQSRLL